VAACLACATACDTAATRLIEQGGPRALVDALIACIATTRLLADLLAEGVELDERVLELCAAACERCLELEIDGVDGVCRTAIGCIRALR
jgi:hypothetical protein